METYIVYAPNVIVAMLAVVALFGSAVAVRILGARSSEDREGAWEVDVE